MKLNSIAFKLWSGIVVMTIVILGFSLVFQTEFLYSFYYTQQVKQLEEDCKLIARKLGQGDFHYQIPYASVTRTVNDIIIVTDSTRKITHVLGSNEYKEDYMFGFKYYDRIMRGETVNDKTKMIRNYTSVWTQHMDSLLVGVPIRKYVNNTQGTKFLTSTEAEDMGDGKPDIIGAVYIITPLEGLKTTTNAIRLQFIYIFAVSIVIATLLSFFLSRSFTKPLISINNAAAEISKGNYNTVINLKSSLEIGTLGDTINNLAKQLSRVEQIRKEFIANVSHELRTPLSYLQGYTEILMDGFAETEEEKQRYLGIILEESVRLKTMVDEILQLSQIEAGYIQLRTTPFSVESLIKSTIENISPYASKRKISIKFNKISDEVLICVGDESRIRQVLINLLNNAIKHSFDYGNIIISTYRQNEQIFICVRDFGEGISEEELPFIWDRYYTTNRSREDSTGLGLSIVKNIINAHGTEITVSSTVGEGTEFCFWLQNYNTNS